MENVKCQKYKHSLFVKNKILNICMYLVFVLMVPCTADTAVINVPSDDVKGLIDAINAANANAEPDTINLAPGSTYTLSPALDGRIPFPADGWNGLPSITTEIIINGNGAQIVGDERNTTCEGFGFEFRIFHIDSTANLMGHLTLNDVTVSNGCASGAGFDSNGGGIFSHHAANTVVLNNSTVSGNSALLDGGGISNHRGILEINNSTISGNSADRNGGGIVYSRIAPRLQINNSTISGNSATFGGGLNAGLVELEINNSDISANSANEEGGGIFNFEGFVKINNSTISGNSALLDGGGIFNFQRRVDINNSTISGNSALLDGGGIFNDHDLNVNSSTISENSAGSDGGGILNDGVAGLTNTIIANSLSGEDCAGFISSEGFNIDSDGTCNLTGLGDKPSTDPILGPLAPNGGPTNTHALLPRSPAIDMGNPRGCLDTDFELLTEDQRGFPRPQGEACDIGAYEVQTSPPSPPPPSPPTPTPIGGGTPTPSPPPTPIDGGTPTPSPPPSPTGGGGTSRTSSSGGCMVAEAAQLGSTMANILILSVPAFAVGLRMIRRRNKNTI